MPGGLPAVDPYSAGISTAINLAQTVTGFVNAAKARREAKELERSRPKYQISPLSQQELDLSESELANGGLSSTAENAYNNLNNKQFSSSLGAILRGGGSVNNVADVFGENDEGRQRLALLSDQMRLNKIRNLSIARQQMMEQQDKEFQVNEFAPWQDAKVANSQARQGAEQQIWSGLSGAGSAVSGYFGARADANAYNQELQGRNLTPATQRTLNTPMQTQRTQIQAPNTQMQQRQYPTLTQPNNMQPLWEQIPGANPDDPYQWWQ